jgi:hypothetical protein
MGLSFNSLARLLHAAACLRLRSDRTDDHILSIDALALTQDLNLLNQTLRKLFDFEDRRNCFNFLGCARWINFNDSLKNSEQAVD